MSDDPSFSSSNTENIPLYSIHSNPQVVYSENLILWHACLLALNDLLDNETKEDILSNLQKIKDSLLNCTDELGLERKKREISAQWSLVNDLTEGNNPNSDASCCQFNTANFRGFSWLWSNWLRLLILRNDRFLTSFNMVDHVGSVDSFLKVIHHVTKPVFAILSWTYYLPRLLLNLFMMAKHTIPGPWMSEAEKKVDFCQRFKAQWDRRWFEFLNDGVWCLVGLTTCFILIGALAPFAMCLIIGLYVFDVLNLTAKMYIENRKYNKLIARCSNIVNSLGESENNVDEKQKIKYYNSVRDHLIELKQLNNNALKISGDTAAGLLIGMTFCIPCFPFYFPLIGASIVLLSCGYYLFSKIRTRKKNADSLVKAKLNKIKLFREGEVREEENKLLLGKGLRDIMLTSSF